jgi:hypothetical protein
MEWTQFIIMFLGMVGLFAWNRAEARNDARHMDNKIEANRKETNTIILAIQQEIKDFHARLCSIEEKSRK